MRFVRTMFAAPLVITIASTGHVACNGERVTTTNPPPPRSGSARSTTNEEMVWTVRRDSHDKCTAQFELQIPPGYRGPPPNPPPPFATECPPGLATNGRLMIKRDPATSTCQVEATGPAVSCPAQLP